MSVSETEQIKSNVPELSVSELAFSLKRTLEESFGHVRVRGELSGIKIAASGHLYGDIKDENANVNVVCWKSNLSKLAVKPEEGLEVICTGKVSSYPKSSRYQIIIESMELAGEGALLKMLEERKKKLAAEGLFAPERKSALPYLPEVIGVVTSPTGAVIRDILHRLNDRFPRHVLVWPVPVQGDGAADKIAAAINGFSALPAEGGNVPRPDVIIVARGGGSLEDLMAFNEEVVVRAAADCSIPLISAVGHETDTTLIDYAADERAPTPTAAAEIAVPRRVDLRYTVTEYQQRMLGGLRRIYGELMHRLRAAKLGDPSQILNPKIQHMDHIGHRLSEGYAKGVTQKDNKLQTLAARLIHPRNQIAEKQRMLEMHKAGLVRVGKNLFKERAQRLSYAGKMLESLSYHSVLNRGFVVVRDHSGAVLSDAAQAEKEGNVVLEFRNNEKREAGIGKNASASPKKPVSRPKSPKNKDQGHLF